ncbi:ABC transporter permease [Bacillus sp. WMMC1349]|uniref:ABC transporter permease n=1 Tax=Bacillus sp. WMMC1349 TaxID=2736254 RepID=UPI0015531D05|nr:ABC transporter permease [Bacillus sp. WMMC1349]NPC93804.1 ABC transporter permease [Bacillus sp. WMMC1349]
MKFKDQLTLIRRNMKKNRLRVFMTILATTVACSFLIVLASVGFGLQKSMTEQIMKKQIVTEIKVAGKEGKVGKPVQKKDLQEFENREHVAAIIDEVDLMEQIEATFAGRTNTKINYLTFTDMAAEQKTNFKLDRGRMAKSPNEIVVGYDFGKLLWTKNETEKYKKQKRRKEKSVKNPAGYQGDILGKTIEITVTKIGEKNTKKKKHQFKVVGVKKQSSYAWKTDTIVYLNKNAIDYLKPEKSQIVNKMFVYADSAEHVGEITNALEDKGFYVDSITKRLESINMFFTAFKIGLIFVGVIAVLISAIGIFNTMTMAVTERTQEIGIMKAIGASPNIIRKMFLLESAYIGVIGSVFGIMISYVVSFLMNAFLPVIFSSVSHGGGEEFHITFSYIPLSLVLIATAISAGVAILSGLNPAVKATKTNVLTALRKEL